MASEHDIVRLLDRAGSSPTPKGAIRYYRKALELVEPDSEYHLEAGEGLGRVFEIVDQPEAVIHYFCILAGDTKGVHHYAYERLTLLLEKLGYAAEALDVIRLGIKRRVPTDVPIRRRAWRLADHARLPRPFIPYRPDPSLGYRWHRSKLFWYWAELARDRECWTRAVRRYERVDDLHLHAPAQVWRGHCLEKQGKQAEAVQAYENAIAHYEAHFDPYVGVYAERRPFDRLIIIYRDRGNLEQALETTKRALAVLWEMPPQTWWQRVNRIAAQTGQELISAENWERELKQRRAAMDAAAESSARFEEFASDLA